VSSDQTVLWCTVRAVPNLKKRKGTNKEKDAKRFLGGLTLSENENVSMRARKKNQNRDQAKLGKAKGERKKQGGQIETQISTKKTKKGGLRG